MADHDSGGAVCSLHMDTEPTWRGGEHQLFYTLEGLRARGLPCALLAQPSSPLLERARAAGFDARPFRMRGEADAMAAWRLARLLRDEFFDIVQCHTPHAHAIALVAIGLVAAARKPKLVVVRRVDFSIHRPGDVLSLGRRKYNHADCIVAVSDAVRGVLIRDGVDPAKIALVREGIDVERVLRAPDRTAEVRAALGLHPGEKLVLNVAALTAHKGQRYLVEAVPHILARCPDVRVVIFGEGELRAELEAQAHALSLGDRLFFAGFHAPEEIPSVLKAADVFVMSSVQEGLGTSLFDAMAACVAIVATRTGGIPEIVRDNETGLLVPPRDSSALADAVARLLHDRALSRRLAEAAARFVRVEGTKERMVEETIRVYRKVLGR